MKTKLQKAKGLVSVTLAVIATLGTLSARADLEQIKARGYMTVATEDDYAPYNFVVNGKPEGFHNELLIDLKAFAKAKGFDVRQEILPWTGLLASVSAGQYDVAFTGAIVTDDRLRVFDFAPPFATAQHYFVKLKRDNGITQDIKSLCGKPVGVQGGSSFEARLPELVNMLKGAGCDIGQVVKYQTYPEAYADLANGRVEYVINSLIGVNDLIKVRGNLFEKGFAVTAGGFNAWPVSKNNPQVLQFYTQFMDTVRQNGRLAALQTKWFGESFADLPTGPITSVDQFHELAGIQ
ncbi:polar amino acid transport system substrate-binding protein [Pseudomonas sp. ok272]|uniref:transporter substrate-binding domain-containing protein n=1 Tax=unclassified Pseudomonas TaxID=196821 RepID=UPI0008B71B34|nr:MULTISPECIES: transporter substrate-binding domain-containing protein [unclassified Pseudomonas]SEN23869.1 polar amino acid transport system substrate-binding protein [Pseudomonas sp. ok272]SFN15053.1 polar amino acid transport system substrate-binding protein [Pseudomonas sp. ok602]